MPEKTAPLPNKRIPPAPCAGDRRVGVRRHCNQGARSRPDVLPEDMLWEAQVRDISASGIGLLIDCPFPPGTTLAVELQGAAGALTVLANVVHTNAQPDGWLHGCELTEP